MKLSGRIALVTGGSRGIGRATALAIAREGADVVVNYAKDDEAARDVARRIESMGRRVLLAKADVGDTAQIGRLVEQATSAFGRIDLLVSNAGAGHTKPITETTDEAWQRVMDVNARATLALAREILPGMVERRFGRVVTISSVTGKNAKGYWSKSPYGAAKAALITLTMGIALEGAPYVTANCICPGLVDKGNLTTPEQLAVKERAIGEIPLRRLGTPEDVAETAVFLLSDGAAYITGQTINVNGGFLMQ